MWTERKVSLTRGYFRRSLLERPCHQPNLFNNLTTVSLMFRRSSGAVWGGVGFAFLKPRTNLLSKRSKYVVYPSRSLAFLLDMRIVHQSHAREPKICEGVLRRACLPFSIDPPSRGGIVVSPCSLRLGCCLSMQCSSQFRTVGKLKKRNYTEFSRHGVFLWHPYFSLCCRLGDRKNQDTNSAPLSIRRCLE